MKSRCPNCGTTYNVEESKIPDKGTYARCYSCQTRFFIKRPLTTDKSENIREDRGGCNLKTDKSERVSMYNENLVCHDYQKLKGSDEERSLWLPNFRIGTEDNSAKLPKKRRAKARKKPSESFFPRISSSKRLNFFMDVFSKDLAIDLGTANTLIYIKGKGIVLNEPSVVALRVNSQQEMKVLAVGTGAKEMLGRAPANISAIRPMRGGVIADFGIAEVMLKHFIKRVRNGVSFFRPRIIIAVPFGITPVEKRAVKEAARQAGARKVFLIEEPMAAAIGAGLEITGPNCNMIVDIGGGTTEVAVISLAGIVSSKSLRVAGDKMDDAIIRYIKKKYNFIIGERTSEIIKMNVADACPDLKKEVAMEIKGWDLLSGKPRLISITSGEIREAILEPINAIVNAIRLVLDRTPQELAADIVKNGIMLTGGVSQLKNLDKFISQETGLPITVAESPLLSVALGTGETLDNSDILGQIMIS